ncbi:MAG: hypothetical protein JWO78_1975 [Micavibrio sp.]|nr:hypothetical protein [Micavibrio sp.]
MNKKFVLLTETAENGVKIITPKNMLREKTGFGGLDPVILTRAEDQIRNNDIPFQYPAEELLKQVITAIETAQSKSVRDRALIETICKPVTQLKAGGAMFQYPLLTRISGIVLHFLDGTMTLDEEAFGILAVYVKIIHSILGGRITGDGGAAGSQLVHEMDDACLRYNQKYPAPKN